MKKFLSWERIRQLVPCWEFIRYGGITFLYGVASTVEFNNVVKVGTGGMAKEDLFFSYDVLKM